MTLDSYRLRGNEEGFLSVGKSILDRSSFEPVQDTDTVKPIGGLWATKQNLKDACYNEWIYYITENPAIFYHKYFGCDIPSVFFTLKKDAKILNINSKSMINIIKHIHGTEDGKLDYEHIAKSYDAIYFDLNGLAKDGLQEYVDLFSVNTLLLLNLDCIDYYKQAMVHFEIQDDYCIETYDYNILAKNTKYTVSDDATLVRKRR